VTAEQRAAAPSTTLPSATTRTTSAHALPSLYLLYQHKSRSSDLGVRQRMSMHDFALRQNAQLGRLTWAASSDVEVSLPPMPPTPLHNLYTPGLLLYNTMHAVNIGVSCWCCTCRRALSPSLSRSRSPPLSLARSLSLSVNLSLLHLSCISLASLLHLSCR
jgi:hypothetical protein